MAKLSVGGQAVIEGVMMRGPKDVATAVRDPNGRIQVETHPVSSIADRYPILKKPMLRTGIDNVILSGNQDLDGRNDGSGIGDNPVGSVINAE